MARGREARRREGATRRTRTMQAGTLEAAAPATSLASRFPGCAEGMPGQRPRIPCTRCRPLQCAQQPPPARVRTVALAWPAHPGAMLDPCTTWPSVAAILLPPAWGGSDHHCVETPCAHQTAPLAPSGTLPPRRKPFRLSPPGPAPPTPAQPSRRSVEASLLPYQSQKEQGPILPG